MPTDPHTSLTQEKNPVVNFSKVFKFSSIGALRKALKNAVKIVCSDRKSFDIRFNVLFITIHYVMIINLKFYIIKNRIIFCKNLKKKRGVVGREVVGIN